MLGNKHVDLLIDVDEPEALETDRIIQGQNGGPYPIKMKYGWTISGPIGQVSTEGNHCYKQNEFCCDDNLNEQVRQYFNRNSNESIAGERKMMSLEDRRALSVFQELAQINDGYIKL